MPSNQCCPIQSSDFGTFHHASICNVWHILKLCRCIPQFCLNYGDIKYPFLYGHFEFLEKKKFTAYQICWVGRVWNDSHLFLVKSMHNVVLGPGAYCTSLPTDCILNSLIAGNTIQIWVVPTFMAICYSGVELYRTVMLFLKVVGFRAVMTPLSYYCIWMTYEL